MISSWIKRACCIVWLREKAKQRIIIFGVYGMLLYWSLLKAFRDCFPKGVVNVIYGRGSDVIAPLMTSGRIDVLAFIGTSGVADLLKKQHPKPHRLRCNF
jgi:hypothetical protein